MDSDFWHIVLVAPDVPAIVAAVTATALLVVSGTVSASEVAFFSLSPADKSALDEETHPADPVINRLLGRSEQLMATILIGNNFVNVAIIMLFSFFFSRIMAEVSPALNFLLQSVILAFLLLLFGEIMPKVYASHRPLAFCRRVAPLMSGMERVLHPFGLALVRSTGSLNRRLAGRMAADVSMDDLGDALKLTQQVAKDEKRMLEEIVKFGDKEVKDVMTSRSEMTTLEVSTPFSAVVSLAVETRYSRIPVYEETEDHIRGILYVKDLLPFLSRGDDYRWQALVRPAYFVPENKMIDDLLDDFRRKRLHMAIVVDEFGGTSGLITMEDVLEEIVGEIRDEYDEDERTWKRIGPDEWDFEARTSLGDFYKVVRLDPDVFGDKTDNCESIGGLLLELKQDFPRVGDVLRCAGVTFTVQTMEKRHVETVRVKVGQR